MQLNHDVVLDLYFVYRARLYSLIWCIGSQFIMIIMVIILLTFERNKEGIRSRGKRGCCRKSICDSADGKSMLAPKSAKKTLNSLPHPKISLS